MHELCKLGVNLGTQAQHQSYSENVFAQNLKVICHSKENFMLFKLLYIITVLKYAQFRLFLFKVSRMMS